MDRRYFLKSSSFIALKGLVPASFEFFPDTLKSKKLLGGFRLGNNKYLTVFDFSKKQWNTLLSPALAHLVVQSPRQNELVAALERRGSNLAFVDVESMKVISSVKSPEGTLFYGHGFFSNDGNLLYASGLKKPDAYQSASDGFVFAIDVRLAKIVDQFPSYGALSHDIKSFEAKTLVVSNVGSPNSLASLVEIDMDTKTPLRKVSVLDPSQRFGHFVEVAKDKFLIQTYKAKSGKPHSHGIAMVDLQNNQVREFGASGSNSIVAKDEILSFSALTPSNLIGITVPDSNQVLIYSYPEGRLVKSLGIKSPRGISYDRELENFVVCSSTGLEFVCAKKLEVIAKTPPPMPASREMQKFIDHSSLILV